MIVRDRYQVAGMSAPPAPATAPEPSDSLLRAIAAGLVAAVAGGVAWALIVKTSDYEVGFIAWGIGFLVGHGSRVRNPGREEPPASRSSPSCWPWSGSSSASTSPTRSSSRRTSRGSGRASVSSPATCSTFFREDLDAVFSFFADLLWVGLAVASAWRIPQLEEPEPAPAPPLEPD